MTTSIAICTYNGEKFLREQLESIFAQTVPADEIVICDDGSNDNTLKILEEYQNRFPEILKIYQNETNLGFSKNFEKAIYLCTKDIIITSDQDDIWKINKIEETLNFFTENPDFEAVFNDLEIVDEQLKTLEPSYLNWKNFSYDFISKEIENRHLFVPLVMQGSFVLGCALAIKKDALQKYQLKDFEVAHDYLIAQKLTFKNKLGFIPKTLSFYRQHESQVCGLKYVSENKTTNNKKTEQTERFKKLVYPYLYTVNKAKELFPKENIEETELYARFLENRKRYLKSLSFFQRKKYIAQCIRHQYLDLKTVDFFTI